MSPAAIMPCEGMQSDICQLGGERVRDVTSVRGVPPALVLQADSFAVREALAIVVEALENSDLTTEEIGSIELVLAEALNNIVEHAYRDCDAGEIQLWWTLGPTGLHVRIADTGHQMQEGWVPLLMSRDAAEHAALVPEGGFGWFLIAGLAHNVVYRRENNVNTLTFRMIVGDANNRSDTSDHLRHPV
jgi:serine/threonine-protein kinase RsbW